MSDQLSLAQDRMLPEAEHWTEARALVHQYRRRALAIADDRIADLASDIAGQTRWRLIRSQIVQILEAEAGGAAEASGGSALRPGPTSTLPTL